MKKKLHYLLILFFLMSIAVGCVHQKDMQQATLAAIPIMGEFYWNTDENSTIPLSITFLSDAENQTKQDLKYNIESVLVNNAEDIEITSYEYQERIIDDLNSAIVCFQINLLINLSNYSQETLKIDSIKVMTPNNAYTFDIGIITIHIRHQSQNTFLSLDHHLGLTFGSGLSRYHAAYSNISNESVFLDKIDLGQFEDYVSQITLNEESIEVSDAVQYEIHPGETVEIVVFFNQSPNKYNIFLLAPLLTFHHLTESFVTFTPYATNGSMFSAEEAELLFQELSS